MLEKKLNTKQVLIVLFIIIAAIVIYVFYQNSSSSGGTTSIVQSQREPQRVTRKIEMPNNVNDMPAFLKTFIANDLKSNILVPTSSQEKEKYYIIAQVNLHDSSSLRALSRQTARDFIFAAYNAIYRSNLPVSYVSVSSLKPDGSLALSVGLGKKVANTQEQKTWTDSSIGPTVFINWIKKRYYNSNNFEEKCVVTGQYIN